MNPSTDTTNIDTAASAKSTGVSHAPSVSTPFDPTKHFEIPIAHPDGTKTCTVRFPTDDEWCARSRQQVAVRRSLGRDATKTEMQKVEQVSRELFEQIRQDRDGRDFDDAEAMRVIERLERCQIVVVNKVGPNYVVEMRVLGGKRVVHTLRIPTQRQIMDFGKSAVSVIGRRQSTETRVMLEPSGELWNKVVVDFTGYFPGVTKDGAVPVPIIHKDVALTELLMQVAAETEGDDPE